MTDEIIKLLDELAKRLGIVIDWTSENVMPYLTNLFERFVDYKIAENVFPLVLFAILMFITISLAKRITNDIRNKKESLFVVKIYNYEPSVFGGVSLVCLTIADVILLIVSLISITNLIELMFVPELYVAEWLKMQVN